MPRASEVLSVVVAGPGVAEPDVRTTCPACGRAQRLDEALFLDDDPLEAYYICGSCTAPILVVSTPGVVPWEQRGTEIGGWLLRNPTDVFVRAHLGARELVIPAAQDALR
jgi:hypothetical protein